MIFAICIIFVFLLLAALYESWSVPFSILLSVPLGIFGAILMLTFLPRLDNNIYAQIGLITIIGLAAKNAILIVEFAKQAEERGATALQAAVEAARVRLRPILMTSFAFILGVLPLVTASGPGWELRQALGTAVFYGII